MKSKWETYKGKKIFCANYNQMTLEEVRAEVEAVKAYMAMNTEKSTLVLVDASGTLISPEVLNLFKEVAALSGTGQFAPKTALLGMTGPRRIFVEIVSKVSRSNFVPFDDAQKAKDWLVS
jgi:hypothetical protein